MKTKDLLPCLAVVPLRAGRSRARRGVASVRSRILFALIAVLNLLPAGRATAQTFTSLGNRGGSFDSPIFLGNTLYAALHGLVLSGNTFYGTVPGDSETDYSGAVYAVSTDGTGFTNVYSFSPVSLYNSPYINADGAFPNAGLILSGAALYGTTYWGGSAGSGTVFAVSTNGTGFTVLHNFGSSSSDGSLPEAGLTLAGDALYGTTAYGGTSGNGTVFAIHTNGTGFTNLHSFTAIHTNSSGVYTNSDGAGPGARLILSGNTLYGTAGGGGSSGRGTVFAVSTNGTGFTNLYSFTGGSDGSGPSGLILSGNTLYGTTFGTLFSISFQPQLTITPSGKNVILSWTTNVAGFDYTGYTLQSTTNLISPVAWSTNSPAPVIVAGQNTVTNPITGAQQFYRLIR